MGVQVGLEGLRASCIQEGLAAGDGPRWGAGAG